MKKHLNRIAVDLCTPTAERRPTTAEDIRNDVFIEDFRNSEELYEFVLDLMNMSDEDVIDELGSDDKVETKIDYLISFCTDPGDGSPNIQYCCVDGKELEDVVEYDAFDEVDFDDADSETLVNILLDEHNYEDDDEWDEDDEEEKIEENMDFKYVDKKLMDGLLRKVHRAMDEGQYYLEPTKEELKRFITILIEERGMNEWEGEDWELLADSFFDHKEDSLDEILEWDYDINLDEVE